MERKFIIKIEILKGWYSMHLYSGHLIAEIPVMQSQLKIFWDMSAHFGTIATEISVYYQLLHSDYMENISYNKNPNRPGCRSGSRVVV